MREPPWKLAAGLVLCVGVAGLLCDHLQLPQPRVFNAHLLFGVAVSTFVTTCLFGQRRMARQSSGRELHLYARHVSRWIYILIYVLASMRMGLHLLEIHQKASGHRHAEESIAEIRPVDDFQIYIVYSVIPLWLVRSLVLCVPMKGPRLGQSTHLSE